MIKEHWDKILFVVMIVVVVNLITDKFNQKERDAIRDEKLRVETINEDLLRQTEELKETIKQKETEIADLDTEISNLLSEIGGHKDMIDDLSTQIEVNRFNVRMIDNDSDQLDAFKNAFPEFTRSPDFGIVQVEHEGLRFPFLMMPFHLTDTFIILHDQNQKMTAQITEYDQLAQKYGTVTQLSEDKARLLRQVATLEAEKYTACDSVRTEMNDIWSNRVDKHLDLLNQPRINLGNKYSLGAGLIGGFALCHALDIRIDF